MYVSTGRPLPSQEAPAGAAAPLAGRDMARRTRMDGVRMLLSGSEPDPHDTALFRMLLSRDGAKQPLTDVGRKDPDVSAESGALLADIQDDIVAVAGRHGGIERQESEVLDVAAVTASDLAALGGVVTKVYLDSLHDRQRGIAVALEDQLLPATRLSVLEQEGRLAVDFVSVNQHSRARLRRGAPALAERVARELSRDVSVKVAAHDADRMALEVRAHAYAGEQEAILAHGGAALSRGPI